MEPTLNLNIRAQALVFYSIIVLLAALLKSPICLNLKTMAANPQETLIKYSFIYLFHAASVKLHSVHFSGVDQGRSAVAV